MVIKRVVLLVLDGVGIGELPDASRYGDVGSNTLGNLARVQRGLFLPQLTAMGLGNIAPIAGVEPQVMPLASFGKMRERSAGKDTTTGHWELTGVVVEQPFPTYPHGFPNEILAQLEEKTGKKFIGNKSASGTAIIEELAEQHLTSGYPILYTSADSVLQIAAHEDVVPINELYVLCEKARRVCSGEHAVGRVIARPFEGTRGHFTRTVRRRDFSLVPPYKTVLDHLNEHGYTVWGIGKIDDIFANRGITHSNHTTDNDAGMNALEELLAQSFNGMIFVNLVDFDSKYGHRNDPAGFVKALAAFDRRLPEILKKLTEEDMLIITADHGCDPTTTSTDHSREYVPLLVYGPALTAGVNLGVRESFADVAATIAEIFNLPRPAYGKSFWMEVSGARI